MRKIFLLIIVLFNVNAKILPIVNAGDPILSKKIDEVNNFNKEELLEIIDNMLETVKDEDSENWAGLAANQVGIDKRIVIYRVPQIVADPSIPEGIEERALINPTYEPVNDEIEEDWECCTSIPKLAGKVFRFSNIKVFYTDVYGKNRFLTAYHYHARILQHEIDHLDEIKKNMAKKK